MGQEFPCTKYEMSMTPPIASNETKGKYKQKNILAAWFACLLIALIIHDYMYIRQAII